MGKCFCGLIQAARQYNKKAVQILNKVGFTGGNIDTFLFMKENAKGIVDVALDIDGNLMIKNPEAIDERVD